MPAPAVGSSGGGRSPVQGRYLACGYRRPSFPHAAPSAATPSRRAIVLIRADAAAVAGCHPRRPAQVARIAAPDRVEAEPLVQVLRPVVAVGDEEDEVGARHRAPLRRRGGRPPSRGPCPRCSGSVITASIWAVDAVGVKLAVAPDRAVPSAREVAHGVDRAISGLCASSSRTTSSLARPTACRGPGAGCSAARVRLLPLAEVDGALRLAELRHDHVALGLPASSGSAGRAARRSAWQLDARCAGPRRPGSPRPRPRAPRPSAPGSTCSRFEVVA